MRALVAEAGLSERIAIDSAGTGAWHAGEAPDARARAAAAARGLRLEGQARQFLHSDFERFDYVLAMDSANLRDLRRAARLPQQRDKLHLFRSFDDTAPPGAEVPDPYYGGEGGFDEVLDICERACRGLLAHLRGHHELEA